VKTFSVKITRVTSATAIMKVEARTLHAAEHKAMAIAETHHYRDSSSGSTEFKVECTDVTLVTTEQ